MSHLSVESQAALQNRQQIQLDTEKETKRLLLERSDALGRLENRARIVLKPLEDDKKALNARIHSLNAKSLAIETKLNGNRVEITSQNELLGKLKQDIQTSTGELEILQSTKLGVVSQIEELEAKIADYSSESSNLKTEINNLSQSKIALVDFISNAHAKFEAREAESIRELSILESKKADITQSIITMQSDFELERDNLATRQKALQAQEQSLENRERKVRRDEETNRRNYELMKL